MRRAARRDDNEAQIVGALQAMGWSVQRLSLPGVPDLLLGIHGWVVLAEVKAPKGTLTAEQIRWRKTWRGPDPDILRSVDDAIQLSNRVFRGDHPCV
jgi:hypothetical protein